MAKKVKETVESAQETVTIEQDNIAVFLKSDDNRKLVTEQAIKMYSILTHQSTIDGHEDKIFTETQVCQRTNLSHSKVKKLFQLWQLFGVVEQLPKQEFRFHFTKDKQHELILRGINEVAALLHTDILRLRASIEGDKELSDEQRATYENEIKSIIENILK